MMQTLWSDGGNDFHVHVILLACGTRGAARTHAACGTINPLKCNTKQSQTLNYLSVIAGDVQPLALLAERLHAAQPTLRVEFVTHAAHQARLGG